MERRLLLLILCPAILAMVGWARIRPPGEAKKPDEPAIRSTAAIVADLKTGEVLYSRAADQIRPVASLSKLLAALVLSESGLDLDAAQTVTREDKNCVRRGAPTRLRVGSTYTHWDLLHAALLVSDNVAVVALGRSMGWTPREFGRRMTERAGRMGLRHTRFTDPTGLDEGDVSTAREMWTILQTALADPLLQRICSTETCIVQPVAGKGKPIRYRHTDHYVLRHPWIVLGAKTGFTLPAQYCLAIGARLSDRPIGMVFLGAHGELTRFGDYARTMRWLSSRGGSASAGARPESPPPERRSRKRG
jgi:D-alanyl-D-alanine endopeptidase (penicillin-binding protein 7)